MAPQNESHTDSIPITMPEVIDIDNPSTSATISDSMDVSTATLTPNNPTLLTIPRELRNKILNILFLNPEAPNFEAKPATTRYKNYFAIAAVNKQLNDEAKEELVKARNLVIFTSNGGPCIVEDLAEHCIPIISTRAARKASNLSVMRIHVRYPGLKSSHLLPNKVTSTTIMLASDLPNLCRYLRGHSLYLIHAPDLSEPGFERCFPRMSITISFTTTADLPAPKQRELLRRLIRANRIGKITVSGATDHTVAGVLPGHIEYFEAGPEITDLTERDMIALDGFKYARKQDGYDYIRLFDWKQSLADKARAAGNPILAYSRYDFSARMSRVAVDVNPFAVNMHRGIQQKLMTRYLKAQIGMSWALIEMGNWVKASMLIEKNLMGWEAVSQNELSQNELQKEPIDILRGLQDKCTRHFEANPDLKKQKDTVMAEEKAKHANCSCCCLADSLSAGGGGDEGWEDIDDATIASMWQTATESFIQEAYSL